MPLSVELAVKSCLVADLAAEQQLQQVGLASAVAPPVSFPLHALSESPLLGLGLCSAGYLEHCVDNVAWTVWCD